jgi:uncharacterized protein YecT (DUF1311 family)
MISFSNTHCFLGTIVLLTITAGCSSPQLSQGTVSKVPQKPSTSTSLSTLPAQAATVVGQAATLVSSTESTTQQKNCKTFPSHTQAHECSQLTASPVEQGLDRVYQQLVSQLGGASREKLINSQLAWVSFVEAQCGFETRGFDNGTQSSPVRDRCLERLMQQRTQDLNGYLGSSQ